MLPRNVSGNLAKLFSRASKSSRNRSSRGRWNPGDEQYRAHGGGRAAIHPATIKIAIGAAIWFLVVGWLSFAWDRETDFLLVIVVLFFAMFFTLFLLTASYTLKDPRWAVRETSFGEFLQSDIGIGTGTMRGRDVLIQITLIPVALAFAATLIGLVWVIFG